MGSKGFKTGKQCKKGVLACWGVEASRLQNGRGRHSGAERSKARTEGEDIEVYWV